MSSDGPLGFGDDPDPAAEEARRARIARRQDPDLVAEGRRATGTPNRQPPSRLPGNISRYTWFVGVVGVLLIVVVTLSGLGGDGPGSTGIETGGSAPPFAAPLATSALAEAENNDVNVAVKAGQGDAGNVPACALRRPDVLNFCALYEKGPVVLAFFATRSSECIEQLDRLDDISKLHPEVAFAAVSIRGDLDDVRRIVRDRRWTFPVGFDDDGILANAYGVAVCPQITFVERGGNVQGTTLGSVDAVEIDRRVRLLERP